MVNEEDIVRLSSSFQSILKYNSQKTDSLLEALEHVQSAFQSNFVDFNRHILVFERAWSSQSLRQIEAGLGHIFGSRYVLSWFL